jgi:DMSO/TMAO reductase YedYZ molybdopterin-dependent catalytic subunit
MRSDKPSALVRRSSGTLTPAVETPLALDGRPSPLPYSSHFGRKAFLGLAGLTVGGVAFSAVAKLKVPSLGLLTGQNINGFTIYTITGGFPTFNRRTYRLQVNGLVERPAEYTYDQLLTMPAVEETRYYQCVTGWSVPRPRWKGVRLWDLLEKSGIKTGAKALRFTCFDGAYSESLTLDQAKEPDVLLAYGLDGRALSMEQGLPLRLVVPGMYGYKFAKWVNHVEVVDRVIPGYWEVNGYDVDAYIGRSNGF